MQSLRPEQRTPARRLCALLQNNATAKAFPLSDHNISSYCAGMTEACSSITFDIVREPQCQGPGLPRWITVEPDRVADGGSTSGASGGSWAVCVGRPAPHLEIKIVTVGKDSAKPLENGAALRGIGEDAASCSQSDVGSTNRDRPGAATEWRPATGAVSQQRKITSPLRGRECGARTGALERAHFGPPFREGVIQVRGPNVFSGYWNQPEETAKVLREDGWFSTGDVGYIDNRGRLWLCGREKDMVKTGGENVHATEVPRPSFLTYLVRSLPYAFDYP